MIEGCGPFRLLFKVVLPSSSAVLATLGLFYAVAIWNQFQTPLMFIQDVKLFPLQLKIRQLIDDDNQLISISPLLANTNYNIRTLRTATVVFAIAPIIAVYPYLQKYFSKGAMLGSVKG
jgi:putative aldouronate transport system permease protein